MFGSHTRPWSHLLQVDTGALLLQAVGGSHTVHEANFSQHAYVRVVDQPHGLNS